MMWKTWFSARLSHSNGTTDFSTDHIVSAAPVAAVWLWWQGRGMTNLSRATRLWQTWIKCLTKVSNIWTPWTAWCALDLSHQTASKVNTTPSQKDNRNQALMFDCSFGIFLAVTWKQLWIFGGIAQKSNRFYSLGFVPSTHDLKYHSESIKRRILYLDVVKLVKWYQCSHRFIWQVCTRESHALNLQWKFHIVFFARGISILGSWTGCDTEENLWIKFSPLSIRHLQASGVPVAAHSPHLLLGV